MRRRTIQPVLLQTKNYLNLQSNDRHYHILRVEGMYHGRLHERSPPAEASIDDGCEYLPWARVAVLKIHVPYTVTFMAGVSLRKIATCGQGLECFCLS